MAHSRRLRKHLQQGAEELKEEERASPLCSLFLELSVGTQRREHQLPGHGRVAGLEQASELVLRLPHWAGQKFQGLQTWVRLILPMEGPQSNEVRRDRPRPGEKTLSLGRGTVPLRVQSSAPPPPHFPGSENSGWPGMLTTAPANQCQQPKCPSAGAWTNRTW